MDSIQEAATIHEASTMTSEDSIHFESMVRATMVSCPSHLPAESMHKDQVALFMETTVSESESSVEARQRQTPRHQRRAPMSRLRRGCTTSHRAKCWQDAS